MGNTKSKNKKASSLWRKMFALLTLVLLLIIFGITSKNFLSFANIRTICLSCSITGILALGMTFTIIAGGYDLSMGFVMTLSGVMAAVAMRDWGFPIVLAILVAMLTGAVVGVVNGILIARIKLQPFVATLGTMMVTQGLSLIVSGANVLYLDQIEGFGNITTGSIIAKITGIDIPNAVLIFILMVVLSWFILSKTVYGRYIFAIGSNEKAVQLCGVNTENWMTLVYITSGIFSGIAGVISAGGSLPSDSGLAGVMMASRLVSAQPAIGQGYEMDAIAATVVGGTPLNGGEGSVIGTVIGVFVLTVLLNGLRMLGIAQEWQTVTTGAVIVIAVVIDQRRRTKASKV